jgi:regulator of sigma E protease
MVTLASFILALLILVTVHEFGHYWVARKLGVRVLRFSVGMGKPLFTYRSRPGGMEWVLAPIPLGGYVKMLDEREGPVRTEDLPFAFNRQVLWKRVLIVSAGPAANLLLAWFFYLVLAWHGVLGLRPYVDEPKQNSIAASVGIHAGDQIIALNGDPVDQWQDLDIRLKSRMLQNKSVMLTVLTPTGQKHLVNLPLRITTEDASQAIEQLGIEPWQPPMPAVVGDLLPNSPAERAGLKVGDKVLLINGKVISVWSDLTQAITQAGKQVMVWEIQRDGERKTLTLVAQPNIDDPKHTLRVGVGPKVPEGFLAQYTIHKSYRGWAGLEEASRQWSEMITINLLSMKAILTGALSIKNLGGAVQIASVAGQTAQMGWVSFVSFLAMMSISLGILNFMPIPVLDGGHLMYYAIEFLMGRPLSESRQKQLQGIGIALLVSLTVFTLINDVLRLVNPS